MEAKDLLPPLRSLANKLESHFKDVCDFEFTMQEGKLYLLNARPGRTSAQAAVRIATDLFLEGKMTGKMLVTRINPDQVSEILKPAIIVNSMVRELGKGLPASSGAATGVAAFSADSAVRLAVAGTPAIFLCAEVVPDDIHGMEASVGIGTFLGGMTGHAAVICRGMKKPCVTGLGWSFDRAKRKVITPQGNIGEGDPLAIDGTTGVIYAGRPDLKSPRAFENNRLLLLFRLIDVLSAENELPDDHIGKAWRIRDIMLHGPSGWNRPDPDHLLQNWPVGVGQRAKAFGVTRKADFERLHEEISLFRLGGDSSDYVQIWDGLRSYLLRLLSKNVGLGRHPEFWRPLFDPCPTVINATGSSGWGCKFNHRIQLIGEEFFSINFHVPELIDIATVRIYWAVQCRTPEELWRLDRTNPSGEKLLRGSTDLKALKIVINDAPVPLGVLGPFYNALRLREYYWDWYRANNISRREIIESLTKGKNRIPGRAWVQAQRAGLVSERGIVTGVGESLLRPSNALERARVSARIGW
jgi:phosphohistidine swiveling domain-containing protein